MALGSKEPSRDLRSHSEVPDLNWENHTRGKSNGSAQNDTCAIAFARMAVEHNDTLTQSGMQLEHLLHKLSSFRGSNAYMTRLSCLRPTIRMFICR